MFTMFSLRYNLTVQVVEQVQKYFGSKVYKTTIPRSIRISEAPSYGQPINFYEPKGKGQRSVHGSGNRICQEQPPARAQKGPQKKCTRRRADEKCSGRLNLRGNMNGKRKKEGLGRGLDSLFEDAAPVFESGAKVDTLPLREIEPDPEQPRKTFDEQALGELAASIAEHGLLQPIAVRPRPRGGYSIVAGERRWRACRMAGLNDVPVVIKEVSDEQAMELALVENLQREDLDPVEEATGIRELMTRCGLTQEQAAQKLGKSRSALANSLRLLNLPENVLELLKSGFINIGHAKVILSLPTPELQEQAAQIIADNQLNVRQAEALCKKLAKPAKEPREPKPRGTLPVEVEESLKQVLGSEVNVAYHDGKGKLTVHFYSDEQLRAFANLLGQYQNEE